MVAIHLLFIRVNNLYIFIYCFNRKVKADNVWRLAILDVDYYNTHIYIHVILLRLFNFRHS